MKSKHENIIAAYNARFFLKEFSFSKTEFSPQPGEEKEFADHVIWLDDQILIAQIKERKKETESAKTEGDWFKNKIQKVAVNQICSTLHYIDSYPEIFITNERGHRFDVSTASKENCTKLIVHMPGRNLPHELAKLKHYRSKRAGFIHVMPTESYEIICDCLYTPAEILEYFSFREEVITKWQIEAEQVSEVAILGQYLFGISERPEASHEGYFYALNSDKKSFDLSYMLENLADRIYTPRTSETDYYAILTQFAKLPRGVLGMIKKYMDECLKALKADQFIMPYRLTYRDCGFAFIVTEEELFNDRFRGVNNLTVLAKYEGRTPKQVGICFTKKDGRTYIDYCYHEYEWAQQPEYDALLNQNYPFRKQGGLRAIQRYEFKSS